MSKKLDSGRELAAILLATGDPGRALNYRDMSALSGGAFTVSSMEHQFRSIRARAVYLKDQLAAGALQPKSTPKKRTASDAAATGNAPVAKKARVTKAAVGTKARAFAGKKHTNKQPKHEYTEDTGEDANVVKMEETEDEEVV
ncbi:MAG: hypothetical protein M1835_000158 [Candelina submexicana]|nr:MAG: hypothetical protein M1835_000158 [Candelina submexicana]